MSVFPYSRFALACLLASISSSLIASTAADEVDTIFDVGSSVTLECSVEGIGNGDSIFIWSKGRNSLFEDESIVGGSAEDKIRYNVLKTKEKYTLKIDSLTAADDNVKFICEHNDGEDTKSLETFRLKLRPTAPPPETTPKPAVVDEDSTESTSEEKDVEDDKDRKTGDGGNVGGGGGGGDTVNVIEKEASLGGGDGDNGATGFTLSSALATILVTVYALAL